MYGYKKFFNKIGEGEDGRSGQETRGRGVGGRKLEVGVWCGWRERGKGERKEGEIVWASVMTRFVYCWIEWECKLITDIKIFN